MTRWKGWLLWLGLASILAGCAAPFTADLPGPGVPRLSSLKVTPARVTAGCPVRLTFEFEDTHGDLVAARAHWSQERSNRIVASGRVTLAVEPSTLAGRTHGTLEASFVPQSYGRYWYHLQAEDTSGHKSNVLQVVILADAPVPWSATRCD